MFLALTGFPLVLVSIIAFIVILGLIIAVHEAGHMVVAKKSGILVHEYSLGMGPVLYRKKNKETDFVIRAIPVGGFIQMAGDELTEGLIKTGDKLGLNIVDGKVTEIILDENMPADIKGEVVNLDLSGKSGEALYITLNDGMVDNYYEVNRNAFFVFDQKKKMQLTPYERSFGAQSCLKRFLTLFAGPLMNLVLAFLIYLIIGFASGVPNYDSNVIGEVTTGYAAQLTGEISAGDKITSINGTSVNTWNEFKQVLDAFYDSSYETEVDLGITKADGTVKNVHINETVYIVSIGLTNIQANINNYELPSTVTGLVVGNVGIRYKGDSGNIANGDILTKIQVGNDTPVELSKWSQLVEIFTNIHTATDVKFEYYHYNATNSTYELVSLGDCKVIENYTDEVLNNQRLAKIERTIGVASETHFDFFGCIGNGCKLFWNDFTLMFRTLKLLIAPSDVRQVGVQNLSSFVGIFQLIEKYVGYGFLPLLSLFALLCVNVAVVNLLPIPGLDGGRIVFVLIEAITRKKVSKKVEGIITNVFFILLMILFIYVTFNDIMRFFK